MAKIGNAVNEKLFLQGMNNLGGDMKSHASRRLRDISRREEIIKAIREGRTDRNDSTPVDIDPDGDLTVNDTELNVLNSRFNELKALFVATDDQNPTEA